LIDYYSCVTRFNNLLGLPLSCYVDVYIPLADNSWHDKLRLHQQHYRRLFNTATCDVSDLLCTKISPHKVELMRFWLQSAWSVSTGYSVPLQRCLQLSKAN